MIDDVRIAVDIEHFPFSRRTLRGNGSEGRYQRLRVSGRNGSDYGVRAMSVRDCTKIVLEGSFAGFLQGHNVVGSMDLQGLVAEVVRRVCIRLDIPVLPEEQRRIDEGHVKLERLDVVGFVNAAGMGGPARMIRLLDLGLAGSRSNRMCFSDKTLVYHSHSGYWSIAAYDKASELIARHPQLQANLDPRLLETAARYLRVELRQLRPELERRGWREVCDVSVDSLTRVFEERFGYMLSDLRRPLTEAPTLPARPSRALLLGLLKAKGVDFISTLSPRRQREVRRELQHEHGMDLRADGRLPKSYARSATALQSDQIRVHHGAPRTLRQSTLVFQGGESGLI